MSKYVLSCCSTADLSAAHLDRIGVPYVCFHFLLDGKEYLDDLGKSMSIKDFYQSMVNGAKTQTAQVNVGEFIDFFTPFLKEGKDIIHVSLSSGLSGTCNSALVAVEELSKSFPDRKIYVVDSLGASSGYGLFVDTLADLRDKGMKIEELYAFAEANKLNLHHWFFSTDLTFYVKGGRVSKTAGWIGNLLNLCPMLNMDYHGKLIPRMKLLGKKKAIKESAKLMLKHAQGGKDYNGKCFISNSACYDDAKAVADLIEEAFPNLNGKVLINDIGTTIGSHTGPGTVAVFFWGDKRAD